jgi:predicted metal-dependent HD superfamily phosphohydrolase
LATRHFPDVSGDAALVADIDLCILGYPWERFAEYERQIRDEYSQVEEKEFITGRLLILDGFLRRPEIYHTKHFREKYEKAARANLARSIMRLGAPHA